MIPWGVLRFGEWSSSDRGSDVSGREGGASAERDGRELVSIDYSRLCRPRRESAATGRFAEGGSKEQVGRILFHGLNRPEPADQRAFRAHHPQSDRSQSTRSEALY
jgi:hypothetical protein